MRILIDECVDWRLLRDLPSHDVKTVRQMGWTETVNGSLLKLAEQNFDVLVTTDKNLLSTERRALQDRRCRLESPVGPAAAPS